jgi:hypothetical protein
MAEIEIGARARLKKVKSSAVTMPLVKFLRNIDRKYKLSTRDRLRIVEQAMVLIESNYVHLPLKRAMHAIDPLQRLRLLKKEVDLLTGMQFHRRMLGIFSSTRDLHTVYHLPHPFKDQIAFLPFLIEQYFEKEGKVEKFMVSRIVEEFLPDSGREVDLFEPGVEVLFWNGVPIRRAIEINGETQAGSNLEARFARGLDDLTIRPLEMSMPPDEAWVALTYRTRKGEILTLKQEWSVYRADETLWTGQSNIKKRAAIDVKKIKINQLKKKLYAPRKFTVSKGFEDVFYADIKTVNERDFGYLRLFSFEVEDANEFVAEFRRVITAASFPQEGLIIDVRGNGGGLIRAGERLLQLFTPHHINPELFEFINTPLNLDICRLAAKETNRARWAESIAESVVTGATYSRGFPLSSEESCNSIGQAYHGPVILITDALSYSATDIFAAGFQDNRVGDVLGTSDNTGAGGANVWTHEDLMKAVRGAPNWPFKPLPRGADLRVAVRRSIRVGPHAGRPLEELGITPDHRHHMTSRDVLKANDDLISMAARILKTKPIYSLKVNLSAWQSGTRYTTVSATSKIPARKKIQNIARVDVYVAGRPYKTLDVINGSLKAKRLVLKHRKGKNNLLLKAFDGANNLVAAYRHG